MKTDTLEIFFRKKKTNQQETNEIFYYLQLLLSIVGVSVVGQAILASYGLCFYFGVFYGPVHPTIPFLLLGIGVDDMFVIIQVTSQLLFPFIFIFPLIFLKFSIRFILFVGHEGNMLGLSWKVW